MWIIGLYIIMTCINIGILWKDSISNAIILTRFFGDWKLVLVLYIISIKIRIKQWWKQTCKKIDIDTYELHHIIDGKEIKVLVKIKHLIHTTRVINNKGIDITSKALPYLRYLTEPLKPKYINETSLIVCK